MSQKEISTIAALATGQSAIIHRVIGNSLGCSRLRELGLTNGTAIRLLRQAPFGGPMVFELRGYQLCLRPSEARLVEINNDFPVT